ncbi:MAG: thiamine diphosphokinase [Synergistaceae bacterium]|jgi:thiamine pyrophosphokinase|nr:thiamine diphosphokinase [Synergistaceae bacterium]
MEVTFGHDVGVNQMLVLGGRVPEVTWLRSVASGKVVWAADRGAEVCRAAGISPARALGDFDSIGEEGEAWLKLLGVETERYPADKDYTDFQLCLNRAKGNLLVTGCWGGRFDHAFANVFSVLWGREWGADVRAFADESEILIPILGETELTLAFRERPLALSLLPLGALCQGVTLRGTRWELSGAELSLGRPYAVSNVPVSDRVTVKIEKGSVGVYCLFGEIGL